MCRVEHVVDGDVGPVSHVVDFPFATHPIHNNHEFSQYVYPCLMSQNELSFVIVLCLSRHVRASLQSRHVAQ